ncbi:MAG: hypothetical protein LIO93_03005 [Bacteroidales bacterium]|nr:hypothetical protein [Bacteroidales bacterium]
MKLKISIFLLLFFAFGWKAYSQYGFHYEEEHLPDVRFGPKQGNGFHAVFSLVASYTYGVEDRNGFRLGFGLHLSQTIDGWTFAAGTDAYKAKKKFGLGISYAGIKYLKDEYGGAYYLTHYYQGDKQTSGMINVFLDEVQILFEDDLLSFPFVGFKIYDRYRSAAMEIRYKGWMIGTNVYTSDINGMTDFSTENSKGIFKTGKQISTPFYIGYTRHDLLLRAGWNNSYGGFAGQNLWHRLFFRTPDFHYGDSNNPFLQIGADKPYTLY